MSSKTPIKKFSARIYSKFREKPPSRETNLELVKSQNIIELWELSSI